ncbi:MAG: hypothetical protein KDD66_11080, partial [Bdellovibrionales bacterium]|nr:hypothetical protein [Bdellovibrionales bacterium]
VDGFSVWDGLLSKKMLQKYHDRLQPRDFKKINILRIFNLYSSTILLNGQARGKHWPSFKRYRANSAIASEHQVTY